MGILSIIIVLYCLVGLLDFVSSGHIDPKKIALVIYSFEEDAVRINHSLLGEVTLAMDGNFLKMASILFGLAGVFWFYYTLKIHINIPATDKKYSIVNLFGATLVGPRSAIVFASGIVWVLPGIDYLFLSSSALICTYALYKEPKLPHALPFRVVINLNM